MTDDWPKATLWSSRLPESERVKPRTLYVEEAIQFALESRWSDALVTNEALIERHGADEDAHNRVGKALTELGRHQEALEAYQSALHLNPLNLIAQKNSRKLLAMIEAPQRLAAAAGAIDVDLFAEEPGKSGLTMLAGHSGAVITVAPGDTVELVPEHHSLRARTIRGVLLGEVEPKLARRLLPLIASGNRYSGAVARVDNDRIEVIIREIFQSPDNARKSSFPITRGSKSDFRPYAKESLLARDDADPVGVDDDFDDSLSPGGDETDEGLPGMRTTESDADLDEVVGVDGDDDAVPVDDEEDDDDSDVDTRPEDSY